MTTKLGTFQNHMEGVVSKVANANNYASACKIKFRSRQHR